LKWYETKMIRQLRFAGKFKDTEKFEVAECYKQPNIVKLSWPIYFHLSNNGVDPETSRFKRFFIANGKESKYSLYYPQV